jgi:hypothetical protein
MMLGGLPAYAVSINASRAGWLASSELPAWTRAQPVRHTIRINWGVTVAGDASISAIDLDDLKIGSEVVINNRGNLYGYSATGPAAALRATVRGAFGGLLQIDNGGVIRGAYTSDGGGAYGYSIYHTGRALQFTAAGTITGAVYPT